MANWLTKMFGTKQQQLPSERPYGSVTESPIYGPVFTGKGGIQEALARRGTGFTDKLTAPATSNIYARGATALKDRLAGVGATASAGGLGRSSLRTAQGIEAARRQTLDDQAQALDLERQSQLAEIQQQQQARGLGVNVMGQDIAARGQRAGFEQGTALQQFAQQRADTQQAAEGIAGIFGGITSAATLGMKPSGGSTVNIGGLPGRGGSAGTIVINGKTYNLS